MTKRVIWLIIDSVGIGEAPDAGLYGDEGSNTLEHLYRDHSGLTLPTMESLGMGHIDGVSRIPKVDAPLGAYGKAAEASPGKDTTTGHWEMAGIVLKKPFPVFPEGFPEGFIQAFEKKIGRRILGNVVASGTQIIQELGDRHVETGSPIVYTSADSVFQIAAHEEVIPLEELYAICETARQMFVDDLAVGRVIARPFLGNTEEGFERTSNRRDFSLFPLHETILNKIQQKGLKVFGVGKINDIFSGYGIDEYVKMKDNKDGMEKTMEAMERVKEGLIYTNLVDFDMIYGHRNDVEGYGHALMEFDADLKNLMEHMEDKDVLIVNADHGCDPTTESTDHSREYIPILIYGKEIPGRNLGVRSSFADIGQTVGELLGTDPIPNGISFAEDLQ
ncbi:phosphopentomutase [Alkalibacter rhizosphaerae]|uniref:Phosphopentomutase n=1 Tax=Alkalibacter rhizosphaerae TaxID=2815577 RepID=A0A974XN30_9FIRM|nr:phosphopentomutase [Alkalibacter rhizosphaerae]QSX08911.1 phosphopentomutase [Alkalibacter rhizosphaerae]